MVSPDDYEPRKTSNGYVWLKIYTDLLDEPKFMQLPDQAKAIYFETYLLAGKSDAFGLVTVSDKPATVQDLAWILRRPETDIQESLDALQRAGLVDLDGGLTITKFKKEQGPSMDEKRKQWALDQRKSRARAKGEKLPDEPEPEPDKKPGFEPEPDEKNEKMDGVKELKDSDQMSQEQETTTKTKSVSYMSGDSQDGVSPDNGSSSSFNEYTDTVLSVWQKKTGKKASKSKPFLDMCQYWFDEQVTVDQVSDAIDLVKTYAEPNTPMYLRDVVINLKNTGPQNAINVFRELYEKQKQEWGENES